MSNSNQPPGNKPPVQTLFGVGAPVVPPGQQPGQQPNQQPSQPAGQQPGQQPGHPHPGQTAMGVPGPPVPGQGGPQYPGRAPQPQAPAQEPMGQQQQPYPGQQQQQYPGQQQQQQPYPGQQQQQQPYPGQQQQQYPGQQQQQYPGQQQQPYPGQQQQPYPGQQQQQAYPGQQQQPGQGQFGHQGIANLASKIPVSRPGTLFGVPLATLRDQALEKKALTIAGFLLLISIIIPVGVKGETRFVWDLEKFESMIWPIIAGVSYLLVAFSPENLRRSIPPLLMKWLPFGVAFASILILNRLFPFIGDSTEQWFANVGYAFLIFALLATLANPSDQVARVLVAVGAGMMLIPWINFVFDVAFEFEGRGIFLVIHNLLQVVVLSLAVGCAAFVIKPESVPALRGIDAFKPLVTAVLLVWLPIKVVLLMLFFMTKMEMGADALFMAVHWLVAIFAYLGILMLTAPEAYDELVKLFSGQGRMAPGGVGPYGPGPYGQQPGQQPGQHGQPGYQQPGQPGYGHGQPGLPAPGQQPPAQLAPGQQPPAQLAPGQQPLGLPAPGQQPPAQPGQAQPSGQPYPGQPPPGSGYPPGGGGHRGT